MTEPTLKDRVQERLDAIGINPFEAARRAGYERSFVNDLLIGRKQSVRGEALLKLAEVLDCDPAYLAGAQTEPRVGTPTGFDWPAGIGVCEADVWRAADAPPPAYALNCAATPPDPRHALASQSCFYVADDHAEAAGIRRGSCVVAYAPSSSDGLGDGDLVVVRRTRNGGDSAETAIWRLGVTLEGLSVVPLKGGDPVPLQGSAGKSGGGKTDQPKMVGIVSMACRLF